MYETTLCAIIRLPISVMEVDCLRMDATVGRLAPNEEDGTVRLAPQPVERELAGITIGDT